jgi:hypothetical protein
MDVELLNTVKSILMIVRTIHFYKNIIKHGRKTLRHSSCTEVSLLQVYTSQIGSDYVSFVLITSLSFFLGVRIEYTEVILKVLLAGSETHQKDFP